MTWTVGAEEGGNKKSGNRIARAVVLSDAEALKVGKRIWQNECEGTVAGLTSWNVGEEFPSLGIGHFIWYPVGYEGPFDESFPKWVAYMKSRGIEMPAWLEGQAEKGAPWPNRRRFEEERESLRMRELRTFLAGTVAEQAQFAARRLEGALPKMTKGLDQEGAAYVEAQFYRVAEHPHGIYALMDYVNFKGEGIKESERYRGEGWGLLQVLQTMKGKQGEEKGGAALDAFADAAIARLKLRVANSPPERGEVRWMKGWKNRCDTYRAGVGDS